MAELDYDEFRGGEGLQLPSLGRLLNLAGALVSTGLIVGLGWWGYQLVVRDVSGVPVVRALEGPMRVAPESPGGELTPHTGLAVNNVPAEGIAEAPAERLTLAPGAEGLTDEDMPAGELPVLTASASTAVADAGTQPDPMPAAVPDSASQSEIDSLISAALAEASGNDADPGASTITLVSPDIGGVAKSLIPLARPGSLVGAEPLPVAADGFVSLAPGNVAEGARLAQLGAFDSAEVAMKEWARLAGLFPEFMTDKARVIEEAQSGGKTFFRLRAHGFEDLNDARRFCAALVAGGVNCIPVKQR